MVGEGVAEEAPFELNLEEPGFARGEPECVNADRGWHRAPLGRGLEVTCRAAPGDRLGPGPGPG